MEGMLVVISGPSGAGKGTIYNSLLERMPYIVPSVSVTTRKPRYNETEGVSYFFRSEEQFDAMVEDNMFLEHAEVFGCKYGTPKKHVMDLVKSGKCVMLEIDVKGAAQIKAKFPECVSIFIMPPSFEILENRLRGRATDTEESIERRLSEASRELSNYKMFDYMVFNDDLNLAIDTVRSIIVAESNKVIRKESKIIKLLGSKGE